jgi:hypothetical protein
MDFKLLINEINYKNSEEGTFMVLRTQTHHWSNV